MKKVFLLLLSFLSFGFARNSTVQSDHFIFYGDEKDLTEETTSFCEKQYDVIVKKLSKKPKEKIVINIYPDMKSYHKAIGVKEKDEYNIAFFDKSVIHVVSRYDSESVHDDKSVKASLISNIEKTILFSCFNLSKWLIEAIGFYEKTKFLGPDETRPYMEALRRLVNDEDKFRLSNVIYPYTFKDFKNANNLNYAFQRFFESKALSNSFIEFVIEKWGYSYLLKMEKDKCCCSLFNMSIRELERLWIEHVRVNYPEIYT